MRTRSKKNQNKPPPDDQPDTVAKIPKGQTTKRSVALREDGGPGSSKRTKVDHESPSGWLSRQVDENEDEIMINSAQSSDEKGISNNSLTKHPEETSGESSSSSSDDESEDSADDEWENVWQDVEQQPTRGSIGNATDQYKDISVTVEKPQGNEGSKTKGISQRERFERLNTHRLHVHCLCYFGWRRNRWLNDKRVQELLVAKVPSRIKKGIEEYKSLNAGKTRGATHPQDLLVRGLGKLLHYWKERFTVTCPGLRKTGYTTVENLSKKVSTERGEKVETLAAFRELAKSCHGSRDVGAQLFTALLRRLGLEARMVFSLSPLGFGFSKMEMEDEQQKQRQRRQYEPDTTSIPKKNNARRKANESSDSDSSGSVESGGFIREATTKKKKQFDKDLKFPTFWAEVFDYSTEKWIPVDPMVLGLIATTPEAVAKFEPRGSTASKAKQNVCYVVAYSNKSTAKDVTVRYLKGQVFPGKTKGFRLPPMRFNNEDSFEVEGDWFIADVMRLYRKKEEVLDEEDLDLALTAATAAAEKNRPKDGIPDTISGFKNHPKYVLERNLRKEEAILQGTECVKILKTGTGEKIKEDKVYERSSVVACKSSKTWYMEGRVIKAGEQPLKLVKSAGIRRKNVETVSGENEDDEDDGLQGLYARFQTEIWKPPPVVDGEIPKNAYGNADCFRKTMIPEGAVHINLKGLPKIARKLGIDFAEAVTGFEFKKRRAVPLVEGVLVASENEGLLRDAWRAEEDERLRKADEKRQLVSLGLWKKFLLGLRVIEKINFEYGGDEDENEVEKHNPFTRRQKDDNDNDDDNDANAEGLMGTQDTAIDEDGGASPLEGGFIREDEDMEGGFIRDEDTAGGFIRDDEEDIEGGFIREENEQGGFIREESNLSKDKEKVKYEANSSNSSPLSSLSSADFDSDVQEERALPNAKTRRRRR